MPAQNPYVNKVDLADGTTLVDLTGDTVTAGVLLSGYTAHGADGSPVTGTYAGPVAMTSAEVTAAVAAGWNGAQQS